MNFAIECLSVLNKAFEIECLSVLNKAYVVALAHIWCSFELPQ